MDNEDYSIIRKEQVPQTDKGELDTTIIDNLIRYKMRLPNCNYYTSAICQIDTCMEVNSRYTDQGCLNWSK